MGDWDTFRSCDAVVQTAIAAGDFFRALDVLVQAYQHVVVGYCHSRLGDPDDGKEVAQEVFLAAYTAMPRFRQEASVRTWLFAIARKLCAKRIGQRRPPPPQTEPSASDTGAEVSPEVLHLEKEADERKDLMIERLPNSLNRLRDRERDLLTMRYFAGFTYADIARTLRIPETTARRWVQHAEQHLREILIGEEQGYDARQSRPARGRSK